MTKASEEFAEVTWRTHVDGRLITVEKAAAEHGARLNNHDEFLDSKVSKDAFVPVKLFVYGLMGTMLAAVVGALLKIVIVNHGVGA